MAGAENIVADIGAMSEMVEQLGKSLDEMESHRESLTSCKSLFHDVKQHFQDIHKSLQQKFDELATKERALEEKKSEHRRLVAEQEAAVAAKEQALWDRLQVLKDAAVSAVIEARKKHKESFPVLQNKVSSLPNEVPNHARGGNIPVNKLSNSVEAFTGKVKPLPRLKQLCEQMDFKGLVKFIAENRKILPTIREELPHALRSAYEPAHLVLDALEGFYPQNQSNSNPNSKDIDLQFMRRTCILLMESAASLLGMNEPCCDNLVSSEIKQRAKGIAGVWKPKLAEMDLDASNGYSLEAQAFLQLLATFSISSGFDEDELCQLVVAMSRRRRQAPELCRALGLAHKVQDIVGVLVSKGRRIDAVQFSHDFQVTETFPLVPLLQQYLEDAKATTAPKDSAAAAEKDAISQELAALKIVIKCIEEYKLQEEFPPDALQQRIAEIEKEKVDKKRTVNSAKAPRKKPWVGRGYVSRAPIAVDGRRRAPTVYDDRARYYVGGDGYVDRYPYAAVHTHPAYGASGHYSTYGQQATAPRPYNYPDERVSHPYSGLSSYGSYANSSVPSSSGNDRNYVGSGMQPASSGYASYVSSQSSYQAYML